VDLRRICGENLDKFVRFVAQKCTGTVTIIDNDSALTATAVAPTGGGGRSAAL
jgi:hypothetical protein